MALEVETWAFEDIRSKFYAMIRECYRYPRFILESWWKTKELTRLPNRGFIYPPFTGR